MSVGYLFQTSISLCWNNKRCCHFLLYKQLNFSCYFLICKQNFWFQKRKHSQLSLKCSHVHIEMNYENLKEVTGQIVSVVWHYCQRFSLRCWGKVFQWLPKDTKRFPISVKWNSYMYILQQIELINFRTVEDTRSQIL